MNEKDQVNGTTDQPHAVVTSYVVYTTGDSQRAGGICPVGTQACSSSRVPPQARRNRPYLDRWSCLCRVGKIGQQGGQDKNGTRPGVVYEVFQAGIYGRSTCHKADKQKSGDHNRHMRAMWL